MIQHNMGSFEEENFQQRLAKCSQATLYSDSRGERKWHREREKDENTKNENMGYERLGPKTPKNRRNVGPRFRFGKGIEVGPRFW